MQNSVVFTDPDSIPQDGISQMEPAVDAPVTQIIQGEPFPSVSYVQGAPVQQPVYGRPGEPVVVGIIPAEEVQVQPVAEVVQPVQEIVEPVVEEHIEVEKPVEIAHTPILDRRIPYLHVAKDVNIGWNPVPYFATGLGAFMIASPLMGWIDFRSPNLCSIYCFTGITQFICGLYHWYQGRSLQSFLDFLMGLLAQTFYGGVKNYPSYDNQKDSVYYAFGTILAIYFAIYAFLLIPLVKRGWAYLLALIMFILGLGFQLAFEFSVESYKWMRIVSGIFYFISCLVFWYCGTAVLYNQVIKPGTLPGVDPRI